MPGKKVRWWGGPEAREENSLCKKKLPEASTKKISTEPERGLTGEDKELKNRCWINVTRKTVTDSKEGKGKDFLSHRC